MSRKKSLQANAPVFFSKVMHLPLIKIDEVVVVVDNSDQIRN